jgi:Tfp pilus assembly protein PilX
MTRHTVAARSSRPSRPPSQARLARGQRGAVLLFTLIALVLLLIGTAGMVRSMNTSLTNVGNFAFKRDLNNQGERAVAAVLDAVTTGALASENKRLDTDKALNYSAVLLPSNAQGIPLALLDDDGFASAGTAANDIAIDDLGVRVRYLVDRMSATSGVALPETTLLADNDVPPGASASELNNAMDNSSTGLGAVSTQVVYRITVRVDGPRQTQSFFQSTFKL